MDFFPPKATTSKKIKSVTNRNRVTYVKGVLPIESLNDLNNDNNMITGILEGLFLRPDGY